MRENFNDRSSIKNLINIADGIQKLLGENCEVVIHDLSTLESSLAYVAGNVTNRITGAPITNICLLYTSDAADEEDSVDLGGRRIIKKKKKKKKKTRNKR